MFKKTLTVIALATGIAGARILVFLQETTGEGLTSLAECLQAYLHRNYWKYDLNFLDFPKSLIFLV